MVVFEIFTDIFTSWSKSSWKRFLTSFDEGAFTKLFTERRGRIDAIDTRIQKEINLAFQQRTRISLERIVADQEKLLALVPQQVEQQRYLLGASIQQFLEGQLQSVQPSYESSSLVRNSASHEQQLLITQPNALPKRETLSPTALYDYDRAEVVSVLHEYVDLFKVEMRELVNMSSYAPYLLVDRQVHRQLTSWMQDLNSRNLWIQGPHGVAKPSQNCMTAVSIVALSHENNIPTVSYFCSLNYADHPQVTRTRHTEGNACLHRYAVCAFSAGARISIQGPFPHSFFVNNPEPSQPQGVTPVDY